MTQWALAHEAILRFLSFLLIFVLMAALELTRPRRALTGSKLHRWLSNAGILVSATVSARLLGQIAGPLLAVGMAALAAQQGWGLLNGLALPGWIELIIALLALDFAIWLQHVLSHRIPFFWRLHRVHHADRDIDVTTALRFHPGEIIASLLYKAVIIAALGPSAASVILFEILLNGCALFNHANIDIPRQLDKSLRRILVTPDMHRVHHSTDRTEQRRNFGFCLSVWDRLFGTYQSAPKAGHLQMQIGLKAFQDKRADRLTWSLLLPFGKL